MQRTSFGSIDSIDAICLRSRCVACDALHTVSLPSTYSATAHDGPIEPCVWIAKSYVALTSFAPDALSACGASPTFCSSSSLLTFVARTYSHSFASSGKPAQSDHVALILRLASMAAHSLRASTARKLPFFTTPT